MARDPGLQAERTAMAWSRTAHGALLNALVLLRAGVVEQRREVTAIGALLLLAAALTYAFARRRRRGLLRRGQPAAAPPLALLGVALATGLCSVGALLAIALAIGGG